MFERKVKIKNVFYDLRYDPHIKSWLYQGLECQCGCGKPLIYKKVLHEQNGVPKYIRNHYCKGPVARGRREEYKQWESQFEDNWKEYKYQTVEDHLRGSSWGIAGDYYSEKTNTSLFYASSYEKRAMEILEMDKNVARKRL